MVLILVAVVTLLAGYCSLDFELDASAESLILENDKSLEYYRQIREQYGTDEFLIITYTPDDDFLSEESLKGIESLRDQLLKLDSVESVVSILDVPIIYNVGVKLSELAANLKTIESPDVDEELARKEFLTNPFYRDLIVSGDGKTTALQAIFYPDEKYFELVKRRNNLRVQSSQYG
ncbi:MAG: RND family transporter, partial [Gammaproteobacteria bacterium]|nr:RND family transporter [Gammaproteobacteria bacterium]